MGMPILGKQMRELGRTGTWLSCCGLGGMGLSLAGRPERADAISVLHSALDHGILHIDSANVYCEDDNDIGHNERHVVRAVAVYTSPHHQRAHRLRVQRRFVVMYGLKKIAIACYCTFISFDILAFYRFKKIYMHTESDDVPDYATDGKSDWFSDREAD